MEGRLPETVLNGGAGSGVLRPRLVTAGSGGPGHRPPGTTTWLRGASLYGSGGNAGDGSAAPGRKSPRWSAERRASRVMGRAAPHQRGWSRLASATTEIVRLLALRPPLRWGMDAITRTKPGRSNAPRERTTLRCLTSGMRLRPTVRFARRDFARPRSRVPGERSETRDPGATRREVSIVPRFAVQPLGPGSSLASARLSGTQKWRRAQRGPEGSRGTRSQRLISRGVHGPSIF